MRWKKAWIVASKDFKTFKRRKNIIYSLVGFEIFVSIVLPMILNFASAKAPNASEVLPALINSFSFFFVIGSCILPLGIAAYSLIGEKVQKSLEPLLATPSTDGEILLGKGIAAFLPAILANFIGAIIFMVLIDVYTYSKLQYLFYPNWNIAIILFLLAPLACILSIGFNVLISSKSNDVRSAQQLGGLIVLPLAAVYFLSEINVFRLNIANLLIMSGILLIVDLFIFYLAKATFQREEILTRWK